MEPKKSKYDTNPLDPDFVKNAEESWEEDGGGQPTQEVKGATREIGGSANENARRNVYSEAPTRRYDNVRLDAPYQSVFVPPTYSSACTLSTICLHHFFQSTQKADVTYYRRDRLTGKVGHDPALCALLYRRGGFDCSNCFWCPERKCRVRFHASQALALHVAILVVQTLFGVLGAITDTSIGGKLFELAATIFLIISMIRVWKGEPHHIAPLAEPAQWFNQHIKPRNKS